LQLPAPQRYAFDRPDLPVVVIGGGPAGLTAAMELTTRGERVVVLEAGEQVGGLARTVERDGYRFDLGGHRFFTKQPEIELIWHDLLGRDLLLRPRRSRIRWRGRFIEYPLRIGNLVRSVGPLELGRIGASYARSRMRPAREAENFEQWVTDRFGRRLFENFFHSYTEKVWGVPTDRISADWAAQRIRELSVSEAVRAALGGQDRGHHSLIDEFLYPRLGPGQLWEAMRARIEVGSGEVRTDAPVVGLLPPAGGPPRVRLGDGSELEAAAVISSAPLGELARMLPARDVPGRIRAASRALGHRDFLTVALILDRPSPFPDNWVYVHDPDVAVGRVQNFAAWSEAMVPEDGRSCLGMEYFCFAGDALWSQADEELVERAGREIEEIGLASASDVVAGHVVRVPAAYPIYGEGYAARIARIRQWVETMPWLQQIGRNGLHRYNNVDHSMLTAIRAVENLCDGARHDLWSVNADSAYHEEGVRVREEQQPYLGTVRPALQEIS
jgi:protoporphyrinogen oxidase